MFRLYDWECGICGTITDRLIEVPHGDPPISSVDMDCASCVEVTPHARILSAPARYMGETVLNPMVSGGRFDTTGHRALPQIPDIPGEVEHQERVHRRLSTLPVSEHRRAILDAADGAPSLADYAAHMNRPECREIMDARRRGSEENKQKRQRLAAIKRGEQVNMRNDKCAGDARL